MRLPLPVRPFDLTALLTPFFTTLLFAAPQAGEAVPAPARLGPSPFLTPIREVAPDNGTGGGLWASGAHYKARFDDGIAFYPVLGKDAPRNLPLRWRTTSIAVGGAVVTQPLAAAQARATDWRYELRHGAVTEAYDVRDDGVEQTFVLHERLPAGDLVITGAIESELRAPAADWHHGALTFADAQGTPRVAYGAAVAIDALGRRAAMETAFREGAISLRLSGQWLAQAAFPVVVDPLLSPVTLSTGGEYASGLELARDDVANELMVVYRRASAGTDYDAFARVIPDDLGAISTTVWTDLDASWSTDHVSAAFVGGTLKWIIALERRFPTSNNYSWLRYHLHASGNHTLNTDVTFVNKPASETWTEPDVGGTAAFSTGNRALIVLKSENPVGAPFYGDALGILVDTAANTYGAPFHLAGSPSGTTYDRGGVRVNKQSAGGSSSWVVAFGEYIRAVPGDDWDVALVRVTPAGTTTARVHIPATSTDHKLRPVIDGRDGRYMVVYGLATPGHILSWMHTLRARRFDFADGAAAPTFHQDKVLRTGGQFFAPDIAFDSATRSHWTAVYYTSAWDTYALRIGYDAAVAESAALYTGPADSSAPTVCFNDDTRVFHVAYPASSAGYPVYVRTFVYPSASNTIGGAGCGG
ncbi:MAG TPA: hypothetical protein VK081_03365, partial [Planctomycetota bacterium]|nr:hypothetical protein [Planctomycetota bacterium]